MIILGIKELRLQKFDTIGQSQPRKHTPICLPVFNIKDNLDEKEETAYSAQHVDYIDK